MSQRNIFWGSLLVLIGGLFLLKNLDVLYFNWWNFLRLWPFLLVLLGIVILPINNAIKLILTFITLIIAVLILVFNPVERPGWHFRFDRDIGRTEQVEEQYIYEEYPGNLGEASLSFDAAVGKFRLVSISDQLFEFINEGGLGRYMYSVSEMENSREIDISLEDASVKHLRFRHEAEVKLNPEPVWDIKVDLGAADIDLDLRDFKIRDLDIDGGASSLTIVLGDLYDNTHLKIDAGASSIEIRIPETSACELNTETVLSSRNLDGFKKVADGTYVTDDFSESVKNIVIEIDAAVSSLQVKRY